MEISPDTLASVPRAGAAPAPPPSARFDLTGFEEGQRAGNPWLTASDAPGTRPAPDDDRPIALDRWQPNRPDDAPASDLGLADLLDVINPLQHIPLVGNVYRVLTGDTISGPAQIAGSTLYGGPIGLISGIVKAIATEINGADPGDTLVAGLIGTDAPDGVAVAEAAPEAADDLALAAGPDDDGAPTAAVAPPEQDVAAVPSAPPALTGSAALAALSADLRAPGPAVETFGAEPDVRDDERALGAAVPEHAFTSRMMDGLDKYRALAVERGGAGRPDPARLDRSL